MVPFDELPEIEKHKDIADYVGHKLASKLWYVCKRERINNARKTRECLKDAKDHTDDILQKIDEAHKKLIAITAR